VDVGGWDQDQVDKGLISSARQYSSLLKAFEMQSHRSGLGRPTVRVVQTSWDRQADAKNRQM
jgi:hypothetical protein